MGGKGDVERFWGKPGFGRVDALFTLGSVALLALLVWCGFSVAGEPRRIFLCSHHLKVLGTAFNNYAQDHADALPPAVVDEGTNSTSWDKEIAPYLLSSKFEPQDSKPAEGKAEAEKRNAELAKTAYLFKCPSDTEPRGGALPRSYSMPMYDLNNVDWPPDGDCLGGLGLYLDAKRLRKMRAAKAESGNGEAAQSRESKVPAIERSMVPTPADTALLVERISIGNALWNTKYACIVSAREQFDAKTMDQKKFHNGEMNYLMLDGHVETLSPLAASPFPSQDPEGFWTIKAGD